MTFVYQKLNFRNKNSYSLNILTYYSAGSVQFGLDPTIVHVRKSRMTYGVGVLNKFKEDRSIPE